MATRDQLLALFDLADRKGHDVTQSTMRDHIRLVGPDGEIVKNKNGGAAFSFPGKHRNENAAWEALEAMMATQH